MAPSVIIENHTTASNPRPHVLYTVEAKVDGKEFQVHRRYSEFVALHDALKDPYNLPPKRLLVTTFIPSAWADDALIAERKVGLTDYIFDLLSSPQYKDDGLLFDFLSDGRTAQSDSGDRFDLEDALPSTLTRTKAMSIAATTADGDVSAAAVAMAGAYYPDWSASSVPPESLDFSKFDILFFAFVTPNSSSTIDWSTSSQAIMKRLVASARSSGYGTRIVLSIGGWGGCAWYSQAVSTAANRTKFANAIANAINKYGLDGVDFDWEFPNNAGAGQPYTPADTANLLSFMKLVRTTLGPCKIISAAVSHVPWLGSNGKPLTDVSAFADVMTYINIMNYDVWGASSTPGPNAPIGDLCGTSKQPEASAQGALAAWSAAKFPVSKMLLGLPLYGYVSKSSKTVLTGSSAPSSDMVLFHKTEEKGQSGELKVTKFLNVGHANSPIVEGEIKMAATSLSSYWGQQIAFNEIVKSGALVKKSDGNYGSANGYTMGWDNCSNTPYLFNKAQTTVVTYDDTWSLADKAKFALANGMAGCFTWSLDQDDGLTLQNAVRKALGK